MHPTYGATQKSCIRVMQMHTERYLNQGVSQHLTFSRVHRQLLETGSFAETNVGIGSRRSRREVSVHETVQQSFEEQPNSTPQGIASQIGGFVINSAEHFLHNSAELLSSYWKQMTILGGLLFDPHTIRHVWANQ
ncbi:hypothetical protein TNCT_405141 [Trichonephila clavata]|uniref:Uncharacterized protein n=1 Tax=Trichonephila clavata TaxID=2740835 RepID=A0A8X6L4I4_TRICU|nr:hypothetical protein TNCT_405141 [Trichonephila clavata]